MARRVAGRTRKVSRRVAGRTRKVSRRVAKKVTGKKTARRSKPRSSRVKTISDILSSSYGVSSIRPKKKSTKKKKSIKKKKSTKKKKSDKQTSSSYGIAGMFSSKKSAPKEEKKTPAKKGKGPMKYKDFVKKEFPKAKADLPEGTPFGEVTKEVANRWRKYKEIFV